MKTGRILRLSLILAAATLWMAANVRAGNECKLPAPEIITQAQHHLLQAWIIDDSPILWSRQLPYNNALKSFQAEIKKRMDDLDPYSILLREYLDFVRSNKPVYLAETGKIKLVLAKVAGTIRAMNCLEAALLSVQLERQSMIDQPTEFSVFILKNEDADHPKLKIYYDTRDTPGGKIDPTVISLVDSDLSAGWVLWKHLHNHNFFFQGQISVMGGICPSSSDVRLYNDFLQARHLRSAAITNGFNTIDLDSNDFRKLNPALHPVL